MKMNVGILGCGDFLRLEAGNIKACEEIEVKALFDPDVSKAEKYAEILGGTAVKTEDEILNDDEIDLVFLFVPPWIRKNLILRAAEGKKHVVTTKPLGPNVQECSEMVAAAEGQIKCGVIYNRSGDMLVATYKEIFESGEVGQLALYKQDWLHHYPQWNNWALDPEKNGGPFMDAMIHNLNSAKYLMGRKPTQCTFFSDNHAHESLKCNDTEFMKLDFENNGSAHLLITWAADLEVQKLEGNFREHIDLNYMITDQGWRLTHEEEDGKTRIIASKDGKCKTWDVEPRTVNLYSQFIKTVETDGPMPPDLPAIREAYEDIKILKDASQSSGKMIDVEL